MEKQRKSFRSKQHFSGGRGICRLALIFAASTMVFLSCAETEERPKEPSTERIPDSIIESANIVLASQGKKEAVINAAQLTVFDKEDSTLAKDLKVDFYDEEGNYRSTLTADEGLVRQKTQRLTVWGHVVVVSDSSRLDTESLKWDPLRKLITTEDFVTLKRGSDIVTGYGMEADNNLENIRILNDVKGRITDIPSSEEELDSLEGEPEKGSVP